MYQKLKAASAFIISILLQKVMLYNLKIKNQAPSAEKNYFTSFYLERNVSKELKDKLRNHGPAPPPFLPVKNITIRQI
jgi:hypothetical protein